MVGLTIIVPTVGRDSLELTLESIGMQTGPEDRICVVLDSERSNPEIWGLVHEMGGECEGTWRYIWVGHGAPLGAYGHGARNFRLDLTPREPDQWFVSIDDDDAFLPGAFDAMREEIWKYPQGDRWFVFSMTGGANSHFSGTKVPVMGNEIRPGNVGTPCIVWPASAKARWGTGFADENEVSSPRELNRGYFGDYEFARDLQAELGDPVWVDHVVAEIRP